VGQSSEAARVGDFITRTILGIQMLIVRQPDLSLRAFINRCPHRGGKVETAKLGNKPVFVCSYHGWAFERSGDLRAIPFKQSYGDLCADQKALLPLSIAERHGFLWINLSGGEPQADAQLAGLHLDGAVIGLQKTFTLPLNWKLVLDGAADVLHPPFLHPTGVSKIIHSGATVWLDYGRHGQLINARTRLLEKVREGIEVVDPRRYFATNLILYPNSWLITAPDHLEFWTVWPDESDPARCHVDIRFLIAPEEQGDQMTARLEKSWTILGQALLEEDWPMEEYIQQNAALGVGPPFMYGRGEIPAQHLHRRLLKDIGNAD
jgi:phenylpropionate dioxygenase-like ring-hydroxylating dioxygenase large terminal subunit